jgi:hypothetical protein
VVVVVAAVVAVVALAAAVVAVVVALAAAVAVAVVALAAVVAVAVVAAEDTGAAAPGSHGLHRTCAMSRGPAVGSGAISTKRSQRRDYQAGRASGRLFH